MRDDLSDRKYPPNRTLIGPKKKIGFVCSGGGTKAGAFHLGVALALQEQGFKFRGGLASKAKTIEPPGKMEISAYVGSSAGSIITTYLAAGYSLENIFNSFVNSKSFDASRAVPKALPMLTYKKMFKLRGGLAKEQIKQLLETRNVIKKLVQGNWDSLIEFKWFKMIGLFSTRGIEEFMSEDVLPSEDFKDYIADLFIVATQLNHSRKVVFGKYHYAPPPSDPNCQYNNEAKISQACAASTALPFIFSPYEFKNRENKISYFIDGEIRDSLSSHVAVDAGSDLVFASYTHQPYHLTKAVGSLTSLGLPEIIVQSIYLVVEQKINAYIHGKKSQRNAINAVSEYCKQQGLSEEHRRRICEILESELHHRPDVDTVYIHPSPTDYKMFMREHFSLNPNTLKEIVKSGFKAAIEKLRHYEFADRKNSDSIEVV